MDKAKGLLIKIEVGDELRASKKTNLYFDARLSQEAVTVAKDNKIGKVLEVNDKYIEIYYVEDEDNQQSLYLSPKSKTYLLAYSKNSSTTFGESSTDSTNKKQSSEDKSSNQSNGLFSGILAVITEGLNAYTNIKESSYQDYVNSKTTYPNYTYPKTKINDSNNIEANTPAPLSNNSAFYVLGFAVLLILLVIIFKVSNRAKVVPQSIQNNRVPSVIYVR